MMLLKRILRKLGVSLAEVPPEGLMSINPEYAKYQIGRWTYGKPTIVSWDDKTKLIIGNFCSFADGVTILLGGEHRIDWVTTYPFNNYFSEASEIIGHPSSKGDVIIGNDVWIGYEALIRSGVRIGNGAVIGARSIVTKDVEPYSIVAGNPCRHIRFRFPEPTIQELEAIAWWDLPLEEIKKAIPLLLSSDIQSFTDHYQHTLREETDSLSSI